MTIANDGKQLQIASELANLLVENRLRVVFAESCTAGLLAATLGRTPGISDVLCGSAVTYRNATKAGWLNVDEQLLDDPEVTAVSEPVARQMAAGVLKMTPEANIAVAVTGHLGPDAPAEKDGLVFVALLMASSPEQTATVHRITLPACYPEAERQSLRISRQQDLVGQIFGRMIEFVKSVAP